MSFDASTFARRCAGIVVIGHELRPPSNLEQRDGPGSRRVEAMRPSGHGDRHTMVRAFEDEPRHARPFGPRRRGRARRRPDRGRRSSAPRRRRAPRSTRRRSLRSSSARTRFATCATGRCSSAPALAFSAAAVTGAARRRGTIESVRSGAFARTCDGAEVLRIGDAVQRDEQRRSARSFRGPNSSSGDAYANSIPSSRSRPAALRLSRAPRARGAGSPGR